MANVSSAEGETAQNDPFNGTGHSAGWSLFVVYEDPTLPGKSITSFDGFSAISVPGGNPNLDIPVDGFMGVQPEGQIKEFIAKLAAANPQNDMKEQIEQVLDAGDAALANGDFEQAAQAYSMVMQHDRGNKRAVAGIVDCMLETGRVDQAAALLEKLPEDDKQAVEISGAIKRVEMAQEVAKLGDPNELQARIESNENDHEARADLAKIFAAQGKRDEAVDALITIMRKDREWQEDGARKMLLDFFEAWGAADPASASGRRKLSSILFS